MLSLKQLVVEEDGQGTSEYILMTGLALVSIWAAAAVTGLDEAVVNLWTQISAGVLNASLTGD